MKPALPSRAAIWLPVVIRLTAAGYLVFFVPNLVLAMTHRVNAVLDWGQGGSDDRAVSIMFSTVYLVWAIYLFRSAGAPQANRLFLDFNLSANAAHFGVMLIMPITMSHERRHIIGVLVTRLALHGATRGMLAAGAARGKNLRPLAARGQAWWSGIA